MRVLWLSNRLVVPQPAVGSGSWLESLSRRLVLSGEVVLGNIAFGNVTRVERADCGGMTQWAVPAALVNGSGRTGVPRDADLAPILAAAEEFAADVVHVWGTETFWGLLTARGRIGGPAILEMQGLKSAIAKVYDGGLSLNEKLRCVGLREAVRGLTLWHMARRFRRWEAHEREILLGHRNIGVPSEWMESEVRSRGAGGRIVLNELILRDEFHTARAWSFNGAPVLFCSAAYPAPFKGLHVAIRAAARLKQRFPGIQLRIAGALRRPGLREDGYIAWLCREAARLGVSRNVQWLGALNAGELARELERCSAMVVPSFVESYCLSLAEAMAAGVPSVTSNTGGTAHLAKDEESALFFDPGDDAECAAQLDRVLTDPDLARSLSRQAREKARLRHDPERITKKLLEEYNELRIRG